MTKTTPKAATPAAATPPDQSPSAEVSLPATLTALQPFSWAHGGTRIEEFAEGQEIETSDMDLITVATGEGWAELA